MYTYTTMISQCGSHQQLRRALELVAEMRSRGIACNVHTYSALMNVCIKASELDLALDVYKQMLGEGCSPNLVTYNILIDVYVKKGQWEEGVKILDTLERQVRGCRGGDVSAQMSPEPRRLISAATSPTHKNQDDAAPAHARYSLFPIPVVFFRGFLPGR